MLKRVVMILSSLFAASFASAQWTPPTQAGSITGPITYNGGFVGIGTSAPNTALHVNGDVTTTQNLAMDGATLRPWAYGKAIQGTSGGYFFGQVGDIHIISNAYVTSSGSTGWKYMSAATATNLYMYLGDTVFRNAASGAAGADVTWVNNMIIKADGKVGIGLTNPLQKLSVAGTIESTSGGIKFPDQTVQATAYPFNSANNSADLSRNVAGALTSSVTNISSTGSSTLAAVATSGTSYVRLASAESPATRDWRIGMTDGTGTFRISDNSGTAADVMTISGTASARSIHFTGTVDATKILANYQDVAEWVPAAETMAAGTVVIVGQDGNNTVTPSTHAYDTSVAGVVSANPGVLLGVASASKAMIATTGRVRVRVDATKSPIRKGDLLVTSDRPGIAMKSEPLDLGGVKIHRPGTLIGKALEPLASGQGEILVLLSLQ